MTTRVVNIRKGHAYDVYGGRGGPLGNEFILGPDGNRAEVIAKKRAAVMADPAFQKFVIETCKDKRIGCYCKPLACHCDIYVELCDGTPLAWCDNTVTGTAN